MTKGANNLIVLIDAHFHPDALYSRQPDFASSYKELGVAGLAYSHSIKNLEYCKKLMEGAGVCLYSMGIHPQLPIMDKASELEEACSKKWIHAIGECGFDFFDDQYGMPRTKENEKVQRTVFEYQLAIAQKYRLPVILHIRKAMDLVFEYLNSLSKLEAVIFHSWPGPINEAKAILKRSPNTLFSFGGSLLNGNKKARGSAAELPITAIVTETDAPYQPPREAPVPGARLLRTYSSQLDIKLTLGELSFLRNSEKPLLEQQIEQNFIRVFGHAFL